MRIRWLLLLWLLAATFLGWWAAHNPLPDGFQNEYLHVGNAYDLWGALVALDVWHLRWYMYTGYWPWGFYAVPWPVLALTGPTRLALLAGNLVHLGVLLWGANLLGRTLGGRLAAPLALLAPATIGCLVRYEPNLAVMAWTTAGVACLASSRGLRDRRMVLGWGLCLGVGLMMDRLTVGFFLLPALLPLLPGSDRRSLGNLALGGGVALFLTAAYYREFFLRHSGELLSQAPVGEIDSAGQLTEQSGALGALYYPLTLLDSQAGPVLGAIMLWGLGAAIWELRPGRDGAARRWQTQGVAVAAVVLPVLFFTFVAKKQLYYTLPIVGPLAALAATRRLSWLALLGGIWGFLAVGLGVLPGGPWLPAAWVAPRHTLAAPPSHQVWPLAEALEAMGPEPGGILVFSEDQTLYEGFVALAVREAWPDQTVRGIALDPVGTYEFLGEIDTMLWVGEADGGWPSTQDLERELEADHYVIAELPPVTEVLRAQAPAFAELGRWGTEDVDIVVFRRLAEAHQEPL